MTTEQQEAIEYLRDLRPKIYWILPEGKKLEDDKCLRRAIETVLNLIQEQEKEINKYLEIIASKVIETAKDDLLTEKNIELEKKDNIIDELAKAFKQDDVRSVEGIKQYFERKVENERN